MLTLTTCGYAIAFASALYVRRRLHRIDMAAMPPYANLEARDRTHAALYAKMKRAGRAK